MATLTGNGKRREQQLQGLMLDRLSQRYERQLSREIRRAMKQAAKLTREGQPIDWIWSTHKNNMRKIMLELYERSIEQFAEYFTQSTKRVFATLETKREVPATRVVDQVINNWLQENLPDLITEISETTIEQVRDIVSNGIKEGMTEREIGKLIGAAAPIKAASRAQTIARTETHRAANTVGFETAKQTGLEPMKEWVSSGSRARDSHRRANKQKRPLDEPFVVGGERLMYPSDPRGSAAETINCRCVLVYEFD